MHYKVVPNLKLTVNTIGRKVQPHSASGSLTSLICRVNEVSADFEASAIGEIGRAAGLTVPFFGPIRDTLFPTLSGDREISRISFKRHNTAPGLSYVSSLTILNVRHRPQLLESFQSN